MQLQQYIGDTVWWRAGARRRESEMGCFGALGYSLFISENSWGNFGVVCSEMYQKKGWKCTGKLWEDQGWTRIQILETPTRCQPRFWLILFQNIPHFFGKIHTARSPTARHCSHCVANSIGGFMCSLNFQKHSPRNRSVTVDCWMTRPPFLQQYAITAGHLVLSSPSVWSCSNRISGICKWRRHPPGSNSPPPTRFAFFACHVSF